MELTNRRSFSTRTRVFAANLWTLRVSLLMWLCFVVTAGDFSAAVAEILAMCRVLVLGDHSDDPVNVLLATYHPAAPSQT